MNEKGERITESNCVYIRYPDIRPRFGKAASGFIFLPFVLAGVNRSCAPRFSNKRRKEELRSIPSFV